MKNNLNLYLFGLIGLFVAVTSCEKQDFESELLEAKKGKANGKVEAFTEATYLADCENSVDLVTGRKKLVIGTVDVSIVDNVVSVTYNTTGDWVITETHIQLFTDDGSFTDVPLTTKGSPKIGNFDYKMSHEYVTTYTEVIDNNITVQDHLFIAAHAVVSEGISGLEGLESLLPDEITFVAEFPGTASGAPSYFDVVVSGGTPFDGTYDGYCIDTDRRLTPGATYTGTAFSSYEDFPSDIVEFPENIDLVNWVLNQDFTSMYSDCAGRNYTYGDIAFAIWSLIDDETSTVGVGTFAECAAEEIINLAMENGEGFVPECGDKLGVIVLPDGGDVQRVIFAIDIECNGDETAWAYGPEFPGNDWSMYFMACD